MAPSASGKFTPLFVNSAHGIQTVVDIAETPGTVWFVDSTATAASNAAGYGRRPDKPFATLAYAYSSDSVAANDVVYVMPGHTESISGAGTITADIAGVTVIGLGTGARRPTFNFTATDSTILVTAASTKWSNLVTVANTAVDVVDGIIVTGADCEFIDIHGREDGTTKQFVLWFRMNTGAARCRLIRPRFIGAAGDGGVAAIKISAVLDGIYIEDPWLVGIHSSGTIFSSAAATDTVIVRPVCRQAHATKDSGIALDSGNTGFILSPRIWSATNDADGFNLAIVAAGAAVYDPLVVNLAGERGGVWGTASAAA